MNHFDDSKLDDDEEARAVAREESLHHILFTGEEIDWLMGLIFYQVEKRSELGLEPGDINESIRKKLDAAAVLKPQSDAVIRAILDGSLADGVQQLLGESLRGNGYITLVKDFCIVCERQVYSNDETGHHVSSTRAIGEYHYHDKCTDRVDEAVEKAERLAEGDLELCEGCGAEASHHDADMVPLCDECWASLKEASAADEETRPDYRFHPADEEPALPPPANPAA